MPNMKKYLLGFLLSGWAMCIQAAAPDSIPAKPEDVATPDAIIAALYDVISGDSGVRRNWNRMRSLFTPQAAMIPSGKNKNGVPQHNYMSVEDYIKIIGPRLEQMGFFEREIGRATHSFGNMAQVFSAYDSKRKLTDKEPFVRGINSIQLWNDGKRWWIMNIFWQSETPDTPIPEQFLKKG